MVGCTEPNSTMDSENIVLEKLDTAKLVATVDTAAVDTPFDIWADTRVTTEEGVNEANDIENCGTALAVVDTGTTVLTSATCILRSNTRRAETTTIWLQHNKATSRYTPHSHSLIGELLKIFVEGVVVIVNLESLIPANFVRACLAAERNPSAVRQP
jgi:hypothetical protein